MAFFEIFPWHKNFETGIDLIDEQHKRLVDILNQLAAHLANRSNPIVLNTVFDELASYADYHFQTEEKVWSEHFKDDEWYQEHELTHESFREAVLELKHTDSQKPLDDVIQDVVSFLSRWLAYHILDTDKRMAKAVLAVNSGMDLKQAKEHANEEMTGSMQVLIDTVLTMYDSLSSRTLDLMREKALRKQAEKELHASEERWKFIFKDNGDDVWDWNLETGDVFHSEESLSVFDLVGTTTPTTASELKIHPEDLQRVKVDFQAHLDGETEFYSNKHRVLRENGSWSWVSTRGKVVSRDENGKALRMVGTHTDITERELAIVVYKNSSQAMFVTDTNDTIISINPAFTRITGYIEDEIIGSHPDILKSDRHDDGFYTDMQNELNETEYWEGEVWSKRKNGEVFPQLLTVTTVKSSSDTVDHRIALFSDITEKKKKDEIIRQQAHFDSLTTLPNRQNFQDSLKQEIRRAKRSHLPLAVLFIDLDHFKEVNDTLGHDVGDVLLKKAAQRIADQVRESDTISRIGGDEFTAILPEIGDSINVDHIAQKIIKALTEPFQLGEEKAYISASIGITVYPKDGCEVSELLKNADQAMYLAKISGRGRFSYFTAEMQQEAQERQEIINDLRRAIEEQQFQLYYQPIIDFNTMSIKKAEALIRWNHPTKGVVSPIDFIPFAEQTGLIVSIGDWVFKEAARQVKKWKQLFCDDFQVSINKSPVQFRQPEGNDWFEYLTKLDLPGKNCVIEITESLLMEQSREVGELLLKYRDAGIEVALDDFGTGYSSLAYLNEFHIDYIKIDQSFVCELKVGSQSLALCEAIIVMAHKLNMKVIAEGIETRLQAELLQNMGCDFAQGYFFSQPLNANEFEQFVGAFHDRQIAIEYEALDS